MRYLLLLLISPLLVSFTEIRATKKEDSFNHITNKKVYYGIASYYADKFNGRPTASGRILQAAVSFLCV